MSKAATAMVPAPPAAVRRVPGKASEHNPLAAVVLNITPAHMADLIDEIEATETYLNGLRAVRAAGQAILGDAKPDEAPPIAVVVVEPPKPAPKPSPPQQKATAAGGTTISDVVREVLKTNVERPADEVIAACRAKGVTHPENKLRALISNLKSRMRVAGAAAKPAEPQTATPKDVKTGTPTAAGVFKALPDATAETFDYELDRLRQQVAKVIFRAGRASIAKLVNNHGFRVVDLTVLLNHEWFEGSDGEYRLTAAGKANLEDF